MAGSKAVAKKAQASVPDLVRTPALDIGAEDVALPRIKIGQFMSEQVKARGVTAAAGDIYSITSKDDMDPVMLAEYTEDGANRIRFHVLGLKKGKSVSENGELTLFDYNDPDAPPEAWVTYNYTVALPEIDEDVPYSLLLTRSNAPAAKQLNTVLARNQGTMPAHALAFELRSIEKTSTKGTWYVAQVRQIDVTDEGLAVANKLAMQMSGHAADLDAAGAEPAI